MSLSSRIHGRFSHPPCAFLDPGGIGGETKECIGEIEAGGGGSAEPDQGEMNPQVCIRQHILASLAPSPFPHSSVSFLLSSIPDSNLAGGWLAGEIPDAAVSNGGLLYHEVHEGKPCVVHCVNTSLQGPSTPCSTSPRSPPTSTNGSALSSLRAPKASARPMLPVGTSSPSE